MTVTVRDVLDLPLLAGARAVAAGEAAARREVAWVAVIEWPVEDFVRPAEIVLTTGIGCDDARFTQLAAEVLDSDAAALCTAFHPAGGLAELPPAVVCRAEQQGVPLVELPWELRFADISRAVVERVLADRYGDARHAPQRLFGDFAASLLEGGGLGVLAATLERVLERPVLVLDAELRLQGHGERALELLGHERVAALEAGVASLDARRSRALRALLGARRPREVDEVAELGLGPGTTVAARAGRQTLGMVYVPGDAAGVPLGELEMGALEQAALAAALELLRRRAIAETETRVRGDFLWDVALRRLRDADEIAAKAALLGHNLAEHHLVAAAHADADVAAAKAGFREVRERLAAEAGADQLGVKENRALVLLPDAERGELCRLLERASPAEGPRLSWGLAEEPAPLIEIATGYESAVEALEVGRSLQGPGTVGDARALGPFLALGAIAADEGTMRRLLDLVRPLIEYEGRTARDLLGTLEVFLRENGNASSAARRLHLNRHSLLYRLRKIEELTGRSLSCHDDRFLLELGLRLEKLTPRDR
ncbi:MAG: PucR family transcriptional regulator [Thermoleophilaceae bacterium]